jgi:DNA-directed RNA polymerase subunit RPC12/RpoP
MIDTTCSDCGATLPDDPEGVPRTPCPECGSTRRTKYASATATVEAKVTVQGVVERNLNDTRLAVLGILVAIGLGVGFGVAPPVWAGALAGLGSVVVFGWLIHWPASRRRLMDLMHWLTGS